ncbi:MAG: PASTA domain-containing protein [Chitinophagaceae bacterium]|nr:MAG: PASTA domain-containing protein [Chitinophagaceae bacterium]
MEVKKDILWRVYLCFLGMVILSLVILGKAAVIQGVEGEEWRNMGDSMHQKIVEINAERGTIFSEDGQMLSTSLPQFDIYMDMMADGLRDKNGRIYKKYIDSLSIAFAGYFKDKTAKQYRAEFDKAYAKKSRYFSLKKKLPFEDYKAIRNFPLVRLGKNKSGIIVEENSKRIAPFGLLANRTIGLSREYVNSDGKVKKMNVGLEMSYDSLLNGTTGKRVVRYTKGGAVPIDGMQTEPKNGRDLYTNLNVTMQDIVQNALLKMMVQSEAEYGTSILMEVKTGKIKAIANLGRKKDGSYWEGDNYALRVTEPGSTNKLATLLAVLDKEVYKANDLIEVGTAGRMQVGPRMVTDAERSPKPVLTVEECFAHSSNVAFSKMGYKAFQDNPSEFKDYLKKYHLTTKSPIDLNSVPSPRVASLKKDEGGVMNMVTMSFGYAMQVSPLQTLTLYNAVANNGRMMKPYLVNGIYKNGVLETEFEPEVLEESIAHADAIKIARESMELTAIDGTAKSYFKDMPFKVAGKTGTAHVADGNVKYSDGVYQASFVGYFPADNPQYSCIVVVRTKPHAAMHYGGQLGCPVFKEIATKVYSMYVDRLTPKSYEGVKDSTTYFYAGNSSSIKSVFNILGVKYVDSLATKAHWASVYSKNFKPVVNSSIVKENVMPNLRGMGLKDAISLLEKNGLKVRINGSGKVQSQSLSAGSYYKKGQLIELNLS